METKQLANSLLIIGLILVALIYGKALIMPFIVALVIWYLLNSLKRLIGNIRIAGMALPWYLQLGIAALFFITVIVFISRLIKSNVEQFIESYPAYHDKILGLSKDLTESLNLPISVDEVVQELDLPNLFVELWDSSFSFISGFTLAIIYVLFITAEERIFQKKIRAIFPAGDKLKHFTSAVQKIDDSIRSYISVKTVLCLASAVCSYIVLYFVGVDFAVLWAVLIFLLNYIPIIGAIFGPLFPTLIALIQFDGYTMAIVVVSVLSAVQIIIGNVIEPKVLGDRLNLSPLVVILALSFWGTIWGFSGMILCVPITVIIMIIFSQFPRTKGIAILLSGGKSLD